MHDKSSAILARINHESTAFVYCTASVVTCYPRECTAAESSCLTHNVSPNAGSNAMDIYMTETRIFFQRFSNGADIFCGDRSVSYLLWVFFSLIIRWEIRSPKKPKNHVMISIFISDLVLRGSFPLTRSNIRALRVLVHKHCDVVDSLCVSTKGELDTFSGLFSATRVKAKKLLAVNSYIGKSFRHIFSGWQRALLGRKSVQAFRKQD